MGPAAIAEIARAVGITNGAAHRSCYRLYVQGVLVRIGNAHGPTRYRLREERQEGANVLPEEGDKGKKRVVK
jgi:DNA-binding IclR family transcriptional regulator